MKKIVMYQSRRNGPGSQKEQGFVQGVLLFALAVLVAIIAAFAFANNGNQSSSERENAKVTATVLMKQASDVQDAVSRYLSDGQSLAYLCLTSGVSAITGSADCDFQSPVDLWSQENGYITPPVPPASAFKATETDRNWQYMNFTDDGRESMSTEAAPGTFAYMEAGNIERRVCQAINRVLNIPFPVTESPTALEQCYGTVDDFTYRKVVASLEPVGLD